MIDTLLLMFTLASNPVSDATMTRVCDALAHDLGPAEIVLIIRGDEYVCNAKRHPDESRK
jgi:hypothetical protein